MSGSYPDAAGDCPYGIGGGADVGGGDGADKADAVAAAIGGASPEDVPAAGAVGSEETIWLLDSVAAGALSH